MPKKLAFHPLADLLPMMSALELDALQADIAANGQRDPIVLLDGKILDGRNRYAILNRLAIEPKFIDYKSSWGDPLAYVISKATHRNMSESQKATAAVLVKRQIAKTRGGTGRTDIPVCHPQGLPKSPKDLKVGQCVQFRGEDFTRTITQIRDGNITLHILKGREKSARITLPFEDFLQVLSPEIFPASLKGDSRDIAGNLFGVSGRYISQAEQLLEASEDAFQQVFRGEQTLPRALSAFRRAGKASGKIKPRRVSNHPLARAATCDIQTADCNKFLPTLPRRKVSLVFADPPYNIGVDYGDGGKSDSRSDQDYIQWCFQWMSGCKELLTPDGSMWVLINDEYAAELCHCLKEIGLHMRRWVIWYEAFGVNCQLNFNRCHRHLLYFTASKDKFIFNESAFKRRSARQDLGDKRANPEGKLWDDVWGINPAIPRITGNANERRPLHPNQLPLALVAPIVAGCTDPGQYVFDPFTGSGTTAEAAIIQGRHFIGTESNAKFADSARLRIQELVQPAKGA